MTKLTKKVTALACAMLMTVGVASQVSAGGVAFDFYGARVTGSASKTSTTTASATTTYTNKPTNAVGCTVYVRAYINVNGTAKYGTQQYTSSSLASGSVTGTKIESGGFGTTGYSGQHIFEISFRNASGGIAVYGSGTRTSSY